MGRRPAISEDLKKEVLDRLNKHVKKEYLGRYGVRDVIAHFKGRFLYIEWIEGPSDEEAEELLQSLEIKVKNKEVAKRIEKVWLKIINRDSKPSKLCRLRYSGDIEYWDFQIYKYSDNWYDTEGEFPFSGGTIEECFDAAASLYITETFP